jgi:hypothetical protein
MAAFVVLALATVAAAQQSKVVLVYPATPSPLLAEALVHVRGEFGSVGLSVEVVSGSRSVATSRPEFKPGTYGALVLEEGPGWLVIRAYHPESKEPIVQRLQTGGRELAPNVVAVRAVEALRAALQQYYYTTNKSMPDAVKKIARIQEPAKQPKQPELTPPPVVPTLSKPIEFALWLAPAANLAASHSAWAGGVSGAVSVGRDYFTGAAHLETTLLPFELTNPSGVARVQRMAGLLEARPRFFATSAFGVFLELGAGLSHYRVSGLPNPGYTGAESTHTTAVGLLGVGAEYWLNAHFGLFVSARATLATNAPQIRFAGDSISALERPLLGLALGVVIGGGR